MNSFNSEDVLKKVIQRLSDRATARPFPHLRVIGPTPYGNSTRRSAIFTNFTQNPPHVVGYKVAINTESESKAVWSISEFTFTVLRAVNPKDKDAFEDFSIRMAIELISGQGELTVDSSLRGRVLTNALQSDDSASHESFKVFRCHYQDDLPIRYYNTADTETEEMASLSLHFEKKIEYKEQYWTTEFKARNESEVKKLEDARLVQKNLSPSRDQELDEDGIYYKDLEDKECTYLLTGYLLEFGLKEVIHGGGLFNTGKQNSFVLRTFNTVSTRWNDNSVSFSDHYIGEERIPRMQVSKQSIQDFAQNLYNEYELNLSPIISQTFHQVFETNSVQHTYLRSFQEEAVTKILREMKERNGSINIISVRTAGGKTEAFVIPLLQYCIERLDQRGVKALIFYPTKALANDQAKRLFRALYFANKILTSQGKPEVTMALYHGDITQEMMDDVDWVPFKCAEGCDVHLIHENTVEQNILRCPQCGEVYTYCYLTRGDAHIRLPDILITNPDTFSYLMSRYAERHSILGRSVKGCFKCGWTTPSLNARICYGKMGECKSSLVAFIPQCSPELFIYDEVHLFNGAFGMNVAAFNRRLEQMVRVYRNRLSSEKDYKPVYIGSSATIKNPEYFAATFFGRQPKAVQIIPANPESVLDRTTEGHTRYNLFLLPRAYRSKQTTSLALKYLLEISKDKNLRPRILAFVNSLKDCNDLILETKSRVDTNKFKIDGHNTQYSKEQRSDREVKFNKGELHALFATSTLEVGIDFEDVNALIIYGPPYHFNDYLQRVGRAGRKSDAVVLTVCKANQAIDYWYFEHAREIINQPNQFTHRIPLGNDNLLILTKALKLGVFDYIQFRPDVIDLREKTGVSEKLFDKSRNEWRTDVESSLRNYLSPLIDPDLSKLVNEALSEVRKQILGFQGDPGWSLLDTIQARMDELEGLSNLRSSERSMQVQYTFGMPSSHR